MDSLDLAKRAAAIAEDKKATRILVLDMNGATDVCQHMMICSGSNERQTKAIADAIEEQLKAEHNERPLAVEGKANGHWVLLDYGHIIFHIFFDYVRDYYSLEKLWSTAKIVNHK